MMAVIIQRGYIYTGSNPLVKAYQKVQQNEQISGIT